MPEFTAHPAPRTPGIPGRNPVTLSTLRKRVAAGTPFPVLTCYDATTARWLMQGGVDVLLVGDTAAQMILGHDSTIHAPMDFMVQITAAVKRGAPAAFVMADMPFMSYQASEAEAIRNAGRFLTEGRADAVKLEVDDSYGALVRKLTSAGVPVVAHVGSRPQTVRLTGGYRSAGKTADEARRMVDTAGQMLECGAAMLLVEATAAEVSAEIVKLASGAGVPVIGCGAGPACHGHVVVLQDLLGLSDWQPAFAKPQAAMGQALADAAAKWKDLVASGRYLAQDHPYHMEEAERRKFGGERDEGRRPRT